jgi:hypothetical protein
MDGFVTAAYAVTLLTVGGYALSIVSRRREVYRRLTAVSASGPESRRAAARGRDGSAEADGALAPLSDEDTVGVNR